MQPTMEIWPAPPTSSSTPARTSNARRSKCSRVGCRGWGGEWRALLTKYAKVMRKVSLRRLHCQPSGIEYGEKGEKNHLRLVDSDLDLNGLINALVDLQAGGRILCESPDRMEDDAGIIKQTWEGTLGQRG